MALSSNSRGLEKKVEEGEEERKKKRKKKDEDEVEKDHSSDQMLHFGVLFEG